ncbi:hypothetical protein OIU85_019859 [Salix viminalis]|uniref:Uncharacterized protein n=1 Tax=Salix viminalis TaxID=40686 RepID=A0A9Q0SAT2_SALVM|nr:hypothetical protein OIU85_019859 [Salix viminalis]
MDAAKARSHKNQPPKPQTSTWADRVKVTEARTRFTLDPIPRCVEEGKLEITADMLSDQAEQWDRCMGSGYSDSKLRNKCKSEPYTTNFEITTPFSKDPLRIDVEYEWRPARCDKCRLFGHVCPKEKLSEENKEKEGKEGSAKAQEEHEPLTKASAASQDKQNEDNNPQEPQTKVSATEKSAVGTSKKIWSFMGQSASEDHIPTGDARRVQKGKMKEGDTLMCIANQMDPLLNQSKQGEEESSVSSTAQGSNSHTGDTSPMAFTKVRKKGGSKKNKGATRL